MCHYVPSLPPCNSCQFEYIAPKTLNNNSLSWLYLKLNFVTYSKHYNMFCLSVCLLAWKTVGNMQSFPNASFLICIVLFAFKALCSITVVRLCYKVRIWNCRHEQDLYLSCVSNFQPSQPPKCIFLLLLEMFGKEHEILNVNGVLFCMFAKERWLSVKIIMCFHQYLQLTGLTLPVISLHLK